MVVWTLRAINDRNICTECGRQSCGRCLSLWRVSLQRNPEASVSNIKPNCRYSLRFHAVVIK